jgi:pyruvate carboxylase
VINKFSQPINSSILNNLCQVKQETHMNKKMNIMLVQHLWKQLDHKKMDFENESMKGTK